jgi:hypothetical protein
VVSCLIYSVYAHFKIPAPEPTYQGLVSAGGAVPVSSVPKLDTYLTRDHPIAMIQGRSGFAGLTLYNAKADTVAWQVNILESRTSSHAHNNTAVAGGPRTNPPRRQGTSGRHLKSRHLTR